MSRTIIVEHDRFELFWFFLLILLVLYTFDLIQFPSNDYPTSEEKVGQGTHDHDPRPLSLTDLGIEMAGREVTLMPCKMIYTHFDGTQHLTVFESLDEPGAEILVLSTQKPLPRDIMWIHGVVQVNHKNRDSYQIYMEDGQFLPVRL
ncbi:MAG: hypothetical protein KF734_18915 [Saprospiraceae bacterium]|nr:hypothetical protein [Saprospiraceae bacterium]